MNLSAYPAPIIQLQAKSPSAIGQTITVGVWQSHQAKSPPAAGVWCISCTYASPSAPMPVKVCTDDEELSKPKERFQRHEELQHLHRNQKLIYSFLI
jgi:hypothetical protein